MAKQKRAQRWLNASHWLKHWDAKSIRRMTGYGYLLIAFLGCFSIVNFGLLVSVLAVLVLFDFILALDEYPAVREIAGVIAVLQYNVGPWFLYGFSNYHLRYRMYVSEDVYFPYALCGTCLFLIGMRVPLPFGKSEICIPRGSGKSDLNVGLVLVLIGLASAVLVRYGPGSLSFAFYLLANLRYVGAIYVYTTGHWIRWHVLLVVFGGIYLTSLEHGMFHELLLWGTLAGSYWFIGKQRPIIVRAACIGLAIWVVVVLQVVKPAYREKLWAGKQVSFVSMVNEVLSSDKLSEKRTLHQVTVRASQGWIVSAVMRNVPSRINYANGETISDALVAAVIPRFLDPTKKEANSRRSLNRFTFLQLRNNTQMGLGPLGEGWANFGYGGGIITMFFFGILLNLLFQSIGTLTWKNSYFFYCFPLVFLQVVKSETDFLMIFNHISKSWIIVFAVYYGLQSIGLMKNNKRQGKG